MTTDTYRLPNGDTRVITETGATLGTDGTLQQETDTERRTDETIPATTDGPLADPAALPFDPDGLRAVILGASGECSGIEGTCIVNAIQTIALNSAPTPGLNAALLRALIGTTDISYIGSAEGRNGRRSEVFTIDDPDGLYQQLVLFDSTTGAYAGDETVVIQDNEELGVEAPAVVEFNTVLSQQWITAAQLPPQ